MRLEAYDWSIGAQRDRGFYYARKITSSLSPTSPSISPIAVGREGSANFTPLATPFYDLHENGLLSYCKLQLLQPELRPEKHFMLYTHPSQQAVLYSVLKLQYRQRNWFQD